MELKFNVKQQIITLESTDIKVVANSKNYLYCSFSFSDDWLDTIKTAIFISAKGDIFNVILEDDYCKVPWEVIEYPHFSVSVFGGDLITANKVTVAVTKSGYCEGETPQDPTPDVYAQILELIGRIQISGGGVSEEEVLEIIASKIDKTLTKEGEAADSKAVGDKIIEYVDEQTKIIKSDIEGIQEDVKNEAHFRGYLSTNEKIQSMEATPNDFAYSAESNTKWVYDAENEWQDTGVVVPDQLTPASETTPLVNGVASVGRETAYARGDHRHPTDTTRASAEELKTLKARTDDIASAIEKAQPKDYELIKTITITEDIPTANEDGTTIPLTYSLDDSGNPFKLDAFVIDIACSEKPTHNGNWRCDVNKYPNVIISSPCNKGKYFKVKAERLCEKYWNTVKSSGFNDDLTSSTSTLTFGYALEKIDYATAFEFRMNSAPVGTTVTIYGRRVSE